MSRDPIGELGGANLYGFVENDGVDRIDVLGEKGKCADRSNWKYRYDQVGLEWGKTTKYWSFSANMYLHHTVSYNALVNVRLPFCCDEDGALHTGRIEITRAKFGPGARMANTTSFGGSFGPISIRFSRKFGGQIDPVPKAERADCPKGRVGVAQKVIYTVNMGMKVDAKASVPGFRIGTVFYKIVSSAKASFYLSCCCDQADGKYK